MNIQHELRHDLLVHGKKRKHTTKSILTSIASIFSALIVALLIATMLGYDPFDVFVRLFSVGFLTPVTLFSNIGVFCFAGFAFAFASKAGLFNIGISGQMLAAGTFIVFLTTKWIPDSVVLPTGVGQFIILIAGMFMGGLIATLVGTLDVYLRINSVVSAILLNWIIYFISFFLLATYARDGGPGDVLTNSLSIPDQFRLWENAGLGTGGIIPIVVLIAVFGVLIFVVFKYTVFGHKIKSVGLSADGAKYAGYNINIIKISSFAISGAMAGILACILFTTRTTSSIGLNINVDSVPVEGFNGIAIALIGSNNPLGIFLVSFLFGLFQNSVPGIVIPAAYINVLLGLLMLGSALSIVIIKYKPWKYIKACRYDISYYKQSQNFENRFDALCSKYKSIYHYERQNVYQQAYDRLLLAKEETTRLKKLIKTLQATIGTREQIDELEFKLAQIKEIQNTIIANTHIIWCRTLGNIKEDYYVEKESLKESWKILKINMLIDKHFTFKEIVEEKAINIKHVYDLALTKEVSKLKDSDKDHTTEINNVVNKSNHLRDAKIGKMKDKQAKALANTFLRNKTLKTLAYEINSIHDPKKRNVMFRKVESMKTYKGGE